MVEIWPGLCLGKEGGRGLTARKGCSLRRALGDGQGGVKGNVSLKFCLMHQAYEQQWQAGFSKDELRGQKGSTEKQAQVDRITRSDQD